MAAGYMHFNALKSWQATAHAQIKHGQIRSNLATMVLNDYVYKGNNFCIGQWGWGSRLQSYKEP